VMRVSASSDSLGREGAPLLVGPGNQRLLHLSSCRGVPKYRVSIQTQLFYRHLPSNTSRPSNACRCILLTAYLCNRSGKDLASRSSSQRPREYPHRATMSYDTNDNPMCKTNIRVPPSWCCHNGQASGLAYPPGNRIVHVDPLARRRRKTRD
jgi:hypothetical protein